MGSKEIKPGDLVMIVRPTPCCRARTGHEGVPFIAGELQPSTLCSTCGHEVKEHVVAWRNDWALPASMLIKIDPPANGETREAYKNLNLPKKVVA